MNQRASLILFGHLPMNSKNCLLECPDPTLNGVKESSEYYCKGEELDFSNQIEVLALMTRYPH